VPFSTNGHGWLSVYVVAPLIGGILGGAVHRFILKPAFVRAVQ
jgi:glycerol uptake facilitator-like aquaporin